MEEEDERRKNGTKERTMKANTGKDDDKEKVEEDKRVAIQKGKVVKTEPRFKEEEEEEEDDGDGRSIPAHADFLIVWATPTGYKAARRHNSGSIFIQTFCKILQKYGEKEDFFSLLTRVNSSVAKEEFKINGVDRKQISCFNSMLTKHMKLTKKA